MDLRSRKEVERYQAESGKFCTRCAHLETAAFFDPGGMTQTVHLPCCNEEAFSLGPHLSDLRSTGSFLLPAHDRFLSPVHLQLLSLYFGEIECPESCAKYRSRRIVATGRSATQVFWWSWARFLEFLSSLKIDIHLK